MMWKRHSPYTKSHTSSYKGKASFSQHSELLHSCVVVSHAFGWGKYFYTLVYIAYITPVIIIIIVSLLFTVDYVIQLLAVHAQCNLCCFRVNIIVKAWNRIAVLTSRNYSQVSRRSRRYVGKFMNVLLLHVYCILL